MRTARRKTSPTRGGAQRGLAAAPVAPMAQNVDRRHRNVVGPPPPPQLPTGTECTEPGDGRMPGYSGSTVEPMSSLSDRQTRLDVPFTFISIETTGNGVMFDLFTSRGIGSPLLRYLSVPSLRVAAVGLLAVPGRAGGRARRGMLAYGLV